MISIRQKGIAYGACGKEKVVYVKFCNLVLLIRSGRKCGGEGAAFSPHTTPIEQR